MHVHRLQQSVLVSGLLGLLVLGCGDPSGASAVPGSEASRVFVTGATTNGKLVTAQAAFDGLAAADEVCAAAAADAGLGGQWVAWLSDSATNALDRIGGNGPWERLDGVRVFADRAALAEGAVAPIRISETGEDVGLALVWTGTFEDGTRTSRHCSSWTDDTTDVQTFHPVTGFAGSTDGLDTWSFLNEVSCLNELHLYCFERP